MTLESFHPLVARWFRHRFARPTAVQRRGWAAIASGRSALLTAPTGSGKTLAAFLVCIDRLIRDGLAGRLDEAPRIVYVSPLKALSNDVHKNLQEPLREIADLSAAEGIDFPDIRTATRTGDTPAAERQAMARRPPHIWITTPESLFILLTSDSGRRGLQATGTVIVDEIHAVADDKRGAHLALSLERLAALCERPLVRIGLSATVCPIDEVARLLVGRTAVDVAGRPDCDIIDEGQRRDLDLALELPRDDLGPIATHELWDETIDRVAALSASHRTTLVFVNTRRLVERVAHRLSSGPLGGEAVVAHHGSLSRSTRLRAEERLKKGEAKVCIATASLELGIDIGTVDLVCQLGSPRSVSLFLQRAGRSGHAIGRTPKGRLFPLTRDELVECAALLRLIARGELDRLRLPDWPLDILAQQVVAAAACEDWSENDLFATMTGAWPYRDLPRERFDQVVTMLSEGVATPRGRRSALLHRDGVNGRVRGRRGARLAALTGGGAIPDNADYDVIKEPEEVFVGRINEDFATESMAGDVFLLGNAAWRIRRMERGRVRVIDAQGAAPNIPFWLGEAPARTEELSAAVGELRDDVDRRLGKEGEARRYLRDDLGLPEAAADPIVAYVTEGKKVLGVVPTSRRIVAERFFDESGGMQLVIHAPFGGRINRAWGLALRKRFCRSFDFELQAAATDDGINLSLGPQHSFPLADVFRFLKPRTVEPVLTQAVLPSPIFATRWRWTVTRALTIPRHQGGRRVPAPLLRMRSDDLLAAVFPAQAACQDNAPPGDIDIPDHPLVFETLRDCLREALDVDGLRHLLSDIESGRIELHACDTPQPSVFAHQILNAMPYAFLDDAPLEERRARAVALRRALPDDARDLGRLDPEAIRTVSADAWPAPRDPDELHDSLLGLVLVPVSLLEPRFGDSAQQWLDRLAADRRVETAGRFLMAAERAALARAAIVGSADAILAVVRGWAEVSGPFRVTALAADIGLASPAVEAAVVALENEGTLLRGSYTGGEGEEWCDRRILARIHRATIATLRREIEPVSPALFLRFLAAWQHVAPGTRRAGAHGLLELIEMLQGFEAPATSWERSLLAARMESYDAADFDRLCLAGEVVWGRFSARTAEGTAGRRGPLTRVTPISMGLRGDLPWLVERGAGEPRISSRAAAVMEQFEQRGACYATEIAAACRLLPTEIDEALGELVVAGLATCDAPGPVRRLIAGDTRRGRRPPTGRFTRRSGRTLAIEGRYWRLDPPPLDREEVLQAHAAQLLRRYGVLFRDLLAREAAPPWRELLTVLRTAEARGEVRGGRFVAGFTGEQFALAEAVDALREERRNESAGTGFLVVSACDPLNLAGIAVPGPKVPAVSGNRVVLDNGVPVGSRQAEGRITLRPDIDPASAERARALLQASA